jgi:hypothetical protein
LVFATTIAMKHQQEGQYKEKLTRDQGGTVQSSKKRIESKMECEDQHQHGGFVGGGSPSGGIESPYPFDVLFGRGKPYQDHPGNVRVRKVVKLHKARYCQAKRNEKTDIADEIVTCMKNAGSGGRFLKRGVEGLAGSWVEVSDEEARDKVSHMLRERTCRKKGRSFLEASANLRRLAKCESASEQQQQRQEQAIAEATASEQLRLFAAAQRVRDSTLAPLSSSPNALLAASPAALAAAAFRFDLQHSQLMTSAPPPAGVGGRLLGLSAGAGAATGHLGSVPLGGLLLSDFMGGRPPAHAAGPSSSLLLANQLLLGQQLVPHTSSSLWSDSSSSLKYDPSVLMRFFASQR